LQVINKISNFVKKQFCETLKNMTIMREKGLTVLREYDSINDAEWDKSLLDGAGIYSMIRNELMSAVYPTGVMPAQLVVRSEDVARAEEVLSAYAAD
jgi:hypothetical protein